MRIWITTVGSRGDVQPFVALAVGLGAAGHSVRLSTARRFAPLAAEHGIPFDPTTDALLELMDHPTVRHGLETLTSLGPILRQMPQLVRLVGATQAALVGDSWDAAQRARPDLIVYHPKAFWGPSFAHHLGARAVRAPLQPFFVPTAERALPSAPSLPLGAAYNRLTYASVRLGVAASVRHYLKGWRRQTGAEIPRGPVPTVHGYSRHLVPEPADWPAWATVAGAWTLPASGWTPPAPLAAFLEAGPPPVYVGFGSMAGRDPEHTARTVVEGLRAAGARGVLATGWGGLTTPELGDDMAVVESAPHDGLFARCAAVVHHGGAGTTHAGLRAGRPTVVCPFFGDQPFWGRRVHALGAGPAPIRQTELTAARLASAVRQATTSASVRQRAEALGESIRAEDGIGAAVRFIERAAAP